MLVDRQLSLTLGVLALLASGCSANGADGLGNDLDSNIFSFADAGPTNDADVRHDGTVAVADAGGPCDSEGATEPCVSPFPGVCSTGTHYCLASKVWSACEAAVLPGQQEEVCDGQTDDDCDGLADGDDPSCTCVDGLVNGKETDIDCGGGDCAACGLGAACSSTADCDSAAYLVCSGTTEKRCTQPASCKALQQAYPSAPSGSYAIACGVSPMTVSCDMSTDGGGWTAINLETAHTALGGLMTKVEGDADVSAGIDAAHRPYTRDAAGNHTYYYTFDVPCGFTEFFLDGYVAHANALPGGADTSEIAASTFAQTLWQRAYLVTGTDPDVAGSGDISFGSGSSTGPVTSYAAEGTSVDCESCDIPWPAGVRIFSVGGTSTSFRIGWGEAGAQSEGWYPWWSGTIMVR